VALKVVVPVPAACAKLVAVTAPAKVAFPALVMASAASRVVPPTGPVTAIAPPPATRTSPWTPALVPSTVLDSVVFPPPLDSCIPLVSVIAFANAIGVFVVVIFEPRLLEPAPFCVNAPVDDRAAPFELVVVKIPAFVTVVVPPTIHAAFTVRLFPMKAKLPV